MINGRLSPLDLEVVQGDMCLVHSAARAWREMVAAAARDGVKLWITAGGAYADIEAQRARLAAGAASGIPVAPVGHQTHGTGDRVDVGSFGKNWGTAGIRRRDWLLAHAAEFGFRREFGDADPNHFRHYPPRPAEQDDTMIQLSAIPGPTPGTFLRKARLLAPNWYSAMQTTPEMTEAALSVASKVVTATTAAKYDAIVSLLTTGKTFGGNIALSAADMAAIDALDDDERAAQTAQLLAAIAAVDEATLATFGLKRA